jgi:hypothetical protein
MQLTERRGWVFGKWALQLKRAGRKSISSCYSLMLILICDLCSDAVSARCQNDNLTGKGVKGNGRG